MPAVFISHASEDKLARVKPLVEALAHQLTVKNLELWIDRPGHGESHFGFDDDFIKKYRIRDLRSGLDWAEQINAALEEAGAVLWCLSKVGLAKALRSPQEVMAQEVLFGWQHKKLVVCIVDDLRFSEVPPSLGSVELSKIQMERVDPGVLERALDCLRDANTVDAEKSLPSDAKQQWEIVRKLARDINSAIGTRTITDDWSLQDVFAQFLAERRTYFFGRHWLFDRIRAWPGACPSERMMLIGGTPGTGKSAIMAHFVDKQPCGPVLAYH
jgi:hypothetical protein